MKPPSTCRAGYGIPGHATENKGTQIIPIIIKKACHPGAFILDKAGGIDCGLKRSGRNAAQILATVSRHSLMISHRPDNENLKRRFTDLKA